MKGDAEVEMTLKELESLRDSLREYLLASDYYARERLAAWTSGSVRFDADGSARIGRWRLGAHRASLVLRLVEPPGAEEGKAHRASVAKQDGRWVVTRLVLERLRPPRPPGEQRRRRAGPLP